MRAKLCYYDMTRRGASDMEQRIEQDEVFVEHKLEHYRQRSNWDCGLACVAMLLSREHRSHFLDNLTSLCEEEGFGQSTWTIDLCYLLKRYDVPHAMYTITMGVNDNFQKQDYYNISLSKDRERVIRRFEEAASNDIFVSRASLPARALVQQLRAGPVVLLVDASVLVCDLCKLNKLHTELQSCLPFSRQYVGHYILLVGYNLVKRKFLYRNPGLRQRLCAVSFVDLERARRSFGTDEDVVFVFKDYRNGR